MAATGVRAPWRRRRGGYVLTLLILLLVTIVVIGSIVGLAALRNGLIRRAGINLIKDSSDPLRFLGKPIDYGICEEPLVYCLDPGRGTDPDPAAGNLVLVGVRADRIVTRNAVYYTNADCFDDPLDPADVFVAPPAAPAPLGMLIPGLPVGYLDALESVGQMTPLSYGVGAPEGFDAVTMLPVGPGRLYRSADEAVAAVDVASFWTSMAPDCTLAAGEDAVSGDLVVYEFTSASAAPTTVAAGVTASSVTATGAVGSGGAALGTGGGCSPADGDTAIICADDPGAGGAPDPNEVPAAYLELTVSCTGGEPLDPTSLSFDGAITGSLRFGRAHVRISTDGFTGTDVEVPTSPMDMLSTTFSNFSFDLTSFAAASALSFRIHPEDHVDNTPGGGNGNRFGGLIDNLTFNGECVGAGAAVALPICTNLVETRSLIRAEEVVEDPTMVGSPNLLEVFTPPFSIMAPVLEYVAPGPEDAPPPVPGSGTTAPGTPVMLPDPDDENAAPLPVDEPGAVPPGPAPTFPAPSDEDG